MFLSLLDVATRMTRFFAGRQVTLTPFYSESKAHDLIARTGVTDREPASKTTSLERRREGGMEAYVSITSVTPE